MTPNEIEKLVDKLWGSTFEGATATVGQRDYCKARYRDILNDSLRADLTAANARADETCEPVIMPAWDDLPKDLRIKRHWAVEYFGDTGVDQISFDNIRNTLQSLQKSKSAAVPLPDKLGAIFTFQMTEKEKTEFQDWARWKGEGPAPARWGAVNPKTKEHTIIYRSYADYAED